VWYENPTKVSLTMPGMRIKENVSLNSILAEILHKVYSSLSVKISPAHRTSLSYQFLLVPQRRARPPPETPSSYHATTTKSRVRQENTLSGRIPSLSPSPGHRRILCRLLPKSLLPRIRTMCEGGIERS